MFIHFFRCYLEGQGGWFNMVQGCHEIISAWHCRRVPPRMLWCDGILYPTSGTIGLSCSNCTELLDLGKSLASSISGELTNNYWLCGENYWVRSRRIPNHLEPTSLMVVTIFAIAWHVDWNPAIIQTRFNWPYFQRGQPQKTQTKTWLPMIPLEFDDFSIGPGIKQPVALTTFEWSRSWKLSKPDSRRNRRNRSNKRRRVSGWVVSKLAPKKEVWTLLKPTQIGIKMNFHWLCWQLYFCLCLSAPKFVDVHPFCWIYTSWQWTTNRPPELVPVGRLGTDHWGAGMALSGNGDTCKYHVEEQKWSTTGILDPLFWTNR